MTARELRLAFPGYSRIRWGNQGGGMFRPEWMRSMRREINERNRGIIRRLPNSHKSCPKPLREMKECVFKRIPFKSSTYEFRMNTIGAYLGDVYVRGHYICSMEAFFGTVYKFVIPDVDRGTTRLVLHTLRFLGVYVSFKTSMRDKGPTLIRHGFIDDQLNVVEDTIKIGDVIHNKSKIFIDTFEGPCTGYKLVVNSRRLSGYTSLLECMRTYGTYRRRYMTYDSGLPDIPVEVTQYNPFANIDFEKTFTRDVIL